MLIGFTSNSKEVLLFHDRIPKCCIHELFIVNIEISNVSKDLLLGVKDSSKHFQITIVLHIKVLTLGQRQTVNFRSCQLKILELGCTCFMIVLSKCKLNAKQQGNFYNRILVFLQCIILTKFL